MSAPWQYLQGAASNTLGGGNTTTVTFASNVQSGSKIICMVTSTSVTATPDAPTTGAGAFTFTAVGAASSGTPNGALVQQMFFLDTPPSLVGTAPTISVVFNATTSPGVSIIEVAGLLAGNTTACLDGVQATKLLTGAASETQPAYTSHYPGEFLVVGYGDNGGPATWTVPAGYSADGNNLAGIHGAGINDSSSSNNAIAYKASTGGAEGTPTWTFAGSPTSMGSGFIVVAFQIAWSSPTQSVTIPPGQQFAPLGRQFGPVPPFSVSHAQFAPAPVSAPVIPYGAIRSPVATGYPADVGPNSTSAGNGATLPRRGRVVRTAGTYQNAPQSFSSGQSSGVRVAQQRQGLAQSAPTTTFQGTGSAFYPFRQPVATRSRGLPQRGRTQGRAGTYDQVGSPVYPLRSPVATGTTISPSSRNGATFPVRGRNLSLTGTFQGTGAPLTQIRRPVQARIPLLPHGRVAGRAGTFTATAVQATFYPLNHAARTVARPQPVRGTARTNIAIPFQLQGPPLTPLQRPVQARQSLPVRGRAQWRYGTFTAVVSANAPFYPLNHPAAAVIRPQPIRGRSQARTGTFQGTGPFVEPLHQPAGTRVIGVRTGGTQAFTSAPQLIGPPFYALNHPVQARRPLPPRGTAQWRYGTFSPFVSVTINYPFRHPVAAVTRPLPIRGRTTSRIGTFQQTGAPVTPQQRALRARLPQQPFLKGRVASNPGIRDQQGPPVTPLQRPVAARTRPLPPRGTAQGRAGTFSFVVQAGPPVYPLHSPVAAVIRPLPGRGRTAGRAGVFQGTGPAVKPLQHPVYAWRPGPRRGVSLTSVRPPAAAGTGSKFYPFRKPVTARQPLPPHGQRWTAPPYVPPFVPAGGHGYPYHAALTITRWSATLTSTEWEADMRNPVRYSAISTSARWPSSLEAGRWFATSGPA